MTAWEGLVGHALRTPLRAASAGVGLTVRTTAVAAHLAGSVALAGVSAATRAGGGALDVVPGVRSAARTVAGLAVEAAGGPPARRRSRRGDRHWIEVRGLAGPGADAIAEEVLESVRAAPGVTAAVLNRPVARLVVTVAPDAAGDLTAVVDAAERRVHRRQRHRPLTLPGDDAALLARALGVAAAATSLGLSLAGAAVR
ncbi:MAG: cation-translocating P-type ATPase, partial [Mycobacterium sp.]|nr:cation-translocating P-type ATPase [Mycobacterium sp.]